MYQFEIENLQDIIINRSKLKVGFVLLGVGVFAGIMFYSASNQSDPNKVLGANIVGFALLALCFVVCLSVAYNIGRIKLNRHNLEITGWSGPTFLSWDDIEDFSIIYIKFVPHVTYNTRIVGGRENSLFAAFFRSKLFGGLYEVKTKDLVDLLNSYQSSVLKSDRTIVYKF